VAWIPDARPGGLVAAKIHLKHISVATTESYSSRPGEAQSELLAEVNKHEQERNLDLVLREFRNYQQGIMPAGPEAREVPSTTRIAGQNWSHVVVQ
jgi:hypothetical protein